MGLVKLALLAGGGVERVAGRCQYGIGSTGLLGFNIGNSGGVEPSGWEGGEWGGG